MVHFDPFTVNTSDLARLRIDAAALDRLSRHLAVAAAAVEPADRPAAAMRLIANVRDFLVAALSEEAEQVLDRSIDLLQTPR